MANKEANRGDRPPFLYDPILYLAACLNCCREHGHERPIRLPFSSQEKRNAWANRHTEDTKHKDIRTLSIRTSDWRVKP